MSPAIDHKKVILSIAVCSCSHVSCSSPINLLRVEKIMSRPWKIWVEWGDITEEMFTCIQEEGNCVMGIMSIDKE